MIDPKRHEFQDRIGHQQDCREQGHECQLAARRKQPRHDDGGKGCKAQPHNRRPDQIGDVQCIGRRHEGRQQMRDGYIGPIDNSRPRRHIGLRHRDAVDDEIVPRLAAKQLADLHGSQEVVNIVQIRHTVPGVEKDNGEHECCDNTNNFPSQRRARRRTSRRRICGFLKAQAHDPPRGSN